MIVIKIKKDIKGWSGIALFPFIIVEKKHENTPKWKTLINHEKIHIRQQLELLIVFFYLWYLIDFIIKYFNYKNWNTAYRNVIFEKEAYANEKNLDYLKNRKFYNFL